LLKNRRTIKPVRYILFLVEADLLVKKANKRIVRAHIKGERMKSRVLERRKNMLKILLSG